MPVAKPLSFFFFAVNSFRVFGDVPARIRFKINFGIFPSRFLGLSEANDEVGTTLDAFELGSFDALLRDFSDKAFSLSLFGMISVGTGLTLAAEVDGAACDQDRFFLVAS